MKKCLIYPCYEGNKWLLEQSYKYFDELIGVVPAGWETSLCGHNLILEDEKFEKEICETDCIWIVDSEYKLNFYRKIVPKIEQAISLGKQIFFSREITREEKELLDSFGKIIYSSQIMGGFDSTLNKKEIYDIDSPILLFTGTNREINDMQYILDVKNCFESKGYRVATFCDNKEIEMIKNGFSLFDLLENTGCFSEKAIMTNHYIKHIEMSENPELIILGMMSGVSVLSRRVVDDLGINVFGITKAVKPDCVILNIPYGDFGRESLAEISKEASQVIGEEIDYFNLTNKIIDLPESEGKGKTSVIYIDNVFCDKIIEELADGNIFNLSKENEYRNLVDKVIDKLEGYANVLSI